MKPKYVYILWHIYRLSKFDDEEKMIGIFEKRIDAKKVSLKLKSKPGFKKHPKGFKIFRYTVGQVGWVDGFTSV